MRYLKQLISSTVSSDVCFNNRLEYGVIVIGRRVEAVSSSAEATWSAMETFISATPISWMTSSTLPMKIL